MTFCLNMREYSSPRVAQEAEWPHISSIGGTGDQEGTQHPEQPLNLALL